MSTVIRAESRLQAKGEIAPARRAGVIYRHSDDIEFLADIESELKTVLHTGEGATKTSFDVRDDDQGMRWIVLEDGNFPDLVSSTYTVGNAMGANGASENLLAAVFELYFTGMVSDETFRTASRTYWIYRYDREGVLSVRPHWRRGRPARQAHRGATCDTHSQGGHGHRAVDGGVARPVGHTFLRLAGTMQAHNTETGEKEHVADFR